MGRKQKHPPGYAGHVEPPHYCTTPRLWWWQRVWSVGDVWRCPECQTPWVLTVDEGGRYWQEFTVWRLANNIPEHEPFKDTHGTADEYGFVCRREDLAEGNP